MKTTIKTTPEAPGKFQIDGIFEYRDMNFSLPPPKQFWKESRNTSLSLGEIEAPNLGHSLKSKERVCAIAAQYVSYA